MDSIPSSISKPLAEGMAKSGNDFYAFLLLVLILGGIALIMWYRLKSQSMQNSSTKDTLCDGGCPELKGFEKILDSRFTSLEKMLLTRMQSIEHRMDTNEAREEVRFENLNSKMDEGFRALHERIDTHIEKHAGGR